MTIRLLRVAALLLSVAVAAQATAAPITFPFRFADPASTAQAIGSITFESTLLANPGVNDFSLPNSAVLALNVTVTGSAGGNGTFTMDDFTNVVFDTNGATLDFGSQLVGQPTSGGTWGTPDGSSGDFNLFSGVLNGASRYPTATNAPSGNNVPNGVFFFTLGANGGNGEPMVLTSMIAGGQAPAAALPLSPAALWVMAGLLGTGAVFVLRRRRLRA